MRYLICLVVMLCSFSLNASDNNAKNIGDVTEFVSNFTVNDSNAISYRLVPFVDNSNIYVYSRLYSSDNNKVFYWIKSKNSYYEVPTPFINREYLSSEILMIARIYGNRFHSFNNVMANLYLTISPIANIEEVVRKKIDIFFSDMEFYNENIIMMSSSNNGWNMDSISTVYAFVYDSEINLIRRKFFKIKGKKFLNYIPRNVIDFKGGIYAVSDITNYKIVIYDFEFNPVDTLRRNDHRFREPDEFNEIQSDSTLNYNYISKVMFIDSTRLFVSLHEYIPNDEGNATYRYFYDIWKKVDNDWELEYHDLSSDRMSYDDLYDPNKQKTDGWVYAEDGYLITIEKIPFEITEEDRKLTYGEFLRKRDKQLWENKNTMYSVFIRKFK
jgi:hypothetical protein